MKLRFFLSLVPVLLVTATAAASINGYSGGGGGDPPLPLDNTWQTWNFLDVGSPGDPQPWTFTSATPVVLQVTDGFLSGDQFNVFDNLVSLGMTSVPTTDGDSTLSFDVAFADPRWSSGQWILPSGSHSITFQTVLSPFQSGSAALRARGSAVPEPSTIAAWSLLAMLSFVFGYYRRNN